MHPTCSPTRSANNPWAVLGHDCVVAGVGQVRGTTAHRLPSAMRRVPRRSLFRSSAAVSHSSLIPTSPPLSPPEFSFSDVWPCAALAAIFFGGITLAFLCTRTNKTRAQSCHKKTTWCIPQQHCMRAGLGQAAEKKLCIAQDQTLSQIPYVTLLLSSTKD